MKKISKILALVLAFSMLMSVSAFAATTLSTGNNGKSITLAFRFTNDAAGTVPLTNKVAGENFHIYVDFSGNPTDEYTAAAYDLFIGYDATKVGSFTKTNKLSTPQVNFNYAPGVIGLAYASLDPMMDPVTVATAASGSLFRLNATALTDLTVAEIERAFSFLVSGGDAKVTKFSTAQIPSTRLTVYGPDAPADQPEDQKVELAQVSCDDKITVEGETYKNVAVATASAPVAGLKEVGFTWVKDGVVSANKANFVIESLGVELAGEGNFEYRVVMYGVTEGTITAVPYYIYTPAE